MTKKRRNHSPHGLVLNTNSRAPLTGSVVVSGTGNSVGVWERGQVLLGFRVWLASQTFNFSSSVTGVIPFNDHATKWPFQRRCQQCVKWLKRGRCFWVDTLEFWKLEFILQRGSSLQEKFCVLFWIIWIKHRIEMKNMFFFSQINFYNVLYDLFEILSIDSLNPNKPFAHW